MFQSQFNYESIKKLAQEEGRRVDEFLALSTANDPNYVGKPAQLRDAGWFLELWQQFGYSDGVHLRRVHYRIISQAEPVQLPITINWTVKEGPLEGQKQSTDVYINNKSCWTFLTKAAKAARYLGYIEAGAFVDRRNPAAIINAIDPDPEGWNYKDPTPRTEIAGGWKTEEDDPYYNDDISYALPSLPELADLPASLPNTPWLKAHGYQGTQQKHLVEVWAEKTTMDDVLRPLCKAYGVNYIRGMGEMSISSVIRFLERVKDTGRPARILYISDFDPAGHQMPVSVSRKIEFYLEALRDEGHDIALKQIVLTQDQIDKYQLPPAPVKDEDKRKGRWDSIHGNNSTVELDSLEAIYPGALGEIVTEEILAYYDPNYDHSLRSTLTTYQILADQETHNKTALFGDDLYRLQEKYEAFLEDWEGTREEFAEMIKPFIDQVEAHRDTLEEITADTQELYAQMKDALEPVHVKAPAVPEPTLPKEYDDELLYSSNRDYFTQLDYYKAHQNGS